MTDAVLARDLRDALNDPLVGMTDAQIDNAILGQLKEDQTPLSHPAQVGLLLANKIAFANALDQILIQRGAVWNAVVYDLTALGLSPGIKRVATEELSAIRTWAPNAGFDAGKALTNLLRIIKAAER